MMTRLSLWSLNKCMEIRVKCLKGEYTIPLGVAEIKREGKDVTIVSFGKIIKEAYKAADELEKRRY